MFNAKIENANGDVLKLTGDEAVYQVVNITGLNPPKAQINTTTIVGLDGAAFNSSKLEMRNIVLLIKINGNVEQNRLNLYKYFRTKEKCTFYYSNRNLDVFIQGYVESIECGLFSKSEQAQISIICPYPYFKSIYESQADSSNIQGQFIFPFSINLNSPVVISMIVGESGSIYVFNRSESETGAIIEIDVINPVSSIQIQDISNGNNFEIDYSFLAEDKIIINTNKGQKSVTLIRNGTISNIFSSIKRGSTFFQLSAGNNTFEYLTDGTSATDDVIIRFKYYYTFRGV